MRVPGPKSIAVLGGIAAAAPAAASAADLTVTVEIPRLPVAEYHRPYVAMWIEKPDQTAVKTLAVWYDVKLKNNEGAEWLKDIRQWWRRAGRSLALPADGVSGPTRAPGRHQVVFSQAQIGNLPAGEYSLVVEASREVGGREVVKAPFAWPPKGAKTTRGAGTTELGALSVTAK
ncbi:DUF2271 domain-containing protein [Phenylobacterium sp. J367]|uniref:DUF2271 domain-containing protein n=1 Tax=Phenylobacterium sp. J367 TaxID=2898435 RepID=UPI002151FCCD|nr:DUF2271 domain-containing protein [Phenylobacterium sp. J367]MCR5878677.1 DUF2271 domain-containing protein [Phenylobacterium sp. J367]